MPARKGYVAQARISKGIRAFSLYGPEMTISIYSDASFCDHTKFGVVCIEIIADDILLVIYQDVPNATSNMFCELFGTWFGIQYARHFYPDVFLAVYSDILLNQLLGLYPLREAKSQDNRHSNFFLKRIKETEKIEINKIGDQDNVKSYANCHRRASNSMKRKRKGWFYKNRVIVCNSLTPDNYDKVRNIILNRIFDDKKAYDIKCLYDNINYDKIRRVVEQQIVLDKYII